MSYNTEHHITPRQVKRAISPAGSGEAKPSYMDKVYVENETLQAAEDPIILSMTGAQLDKAIERASQQMKEAAKRLDFQLAAQYRDEMLHLEELKKKK